MKTKPRVRVLSLAALLTLLGLLLVFPEGAKAEATAPALSGTVTDSTGAVIVGASVSLRDDRGTSRTATTSGRGRYRFEKVPQGSYTLFVYQDGFAPATSEVRIAADPQTLDVTIHPASFSEEVTVSFTGQHAVSALKMDVDVMDIPLTVRSYTTSFIKAVDVKQVADLYTYMTGVDRSGSGAYNVTMRGFTAGEPNNVQINGMPGLPARQNSPNISNVERIEVVKGPISVLYGLAEPGGFVNIITKRPQAERQHVLDLRTGTFFGTGPDFGSSNSYRFATDFTGPLGDSKKVLYRLIFSYDKVESFRDFTENKDLFVVPSLSFNFSSDTFLTIEAEYRKLDNSLDQGLIAPRNDINFVSDITTRYQEPGDFENEDGWSLNAYFTKLFSGDSQWSVTWRSVIHDDTRKGFENNRAENDNRRVRRRDRHQVNHREYHFIDTNFAKRFTTGSVGHTLMFGFNGGKENSDFDRIRFGNVGFFVDLRNPVYGQQPGANPNPGTHLVTDFWRTGVYVQDRVDLSEKWKAIAAIRYDREKQDIEEVRFGNPPSSNTVDDVVPNVGLVFQPDPRWSLYGSFAKSFSPPPASAQDAQGLNPFDPERGRQFEGGIKAQLARGRVDATLSAYHIEKDNVLVSVGGGISEQIGSERSRGVEFDLRLRPLNNWQTIIGYAYTDAEVTEDAAADRIGARLLNTPEHAFNLWSRFDVTSGAARGLGFGIGLIWRGERAGSFPSQVVRGDPIPGEPIASAVLELPSYFRADAGVYYVRDRYELTLRVNNIFDETYYENAFNLIRITPGNPREATLSLRIRF